MDAGSPWPACNMPGYIPLAPTICQKHYNMDQNMPWNAKVKKKMQRADWGKKTALTTMGTCIARIGWKHQQNLTRLGLY